MVTYKDSSHIRDGFIWKIIEEKFGKLDEKSGRKLAHINVPGLSRYQYNKFVDEITSKHKNIQFVGKEGWTKQIRIGEDKYTPSIGRVENNGNALDIYLDKKEIIGTNNVKIMEDIIRIAEEKLREKETQETLDNNKKFYEMPDPKSNKTRAYQYQGFLPNKKNFSWELKAPFFDYKDSYQY